MNVLEDEVRKVAPRLLNMRNWRGAALYRWNLHLVPASKQPHNLYEICMLLYVQS